MARGVKNQPEEKQLSAKEKREMRQAGAPVSEAEAINQQAIQHPDAVASAHGEKAKPSGAGDKVVVACKLGVAYFNLQLCREETVQENTQTGPREVKMWRRTGRVVQLRGTAYPRGTPPAGFPAPPLIVDGAALNFGIDKDFWDEWVKQNKISPLVMNRMVFAHEDVGYVKSFAREVVHEKSGLDPLNPKNDSRMPKPTNPALSELSTEESRAGSMERAISSNR